MKIMPTSYTSFAKYFNRIVTKIFTLGRSISNKIGVFVDYYYARVPVITLAFMSCGFKNFLFNIIIKPLEYSYHADTSQLFAVMIDSNLNISYPLAEILEVRYDKMDRYRGGVNYNGD